MDDNRNDIPSLIEQMRTAELRVWRRFAAAQLMQSEEGRIQLKQFFSDDPDYAKNSVFNWLSPICRERARVLRNDLNYVSINLDKSQQDYARIAVACPICDTNPENLSWIFVFPPRLNCNEQYLEQEGWITFCDQCGIEINHFNIHHTPPQFRTPEYM